jgi:hypothetical protein
VAYFIVYDNSTGKLLRSGVCASADIQYQAADEGATSVEVNARYSDTEYYWDSNRVTSRPEFIAVWDKTTITANGQDTATLSGLPIPATVSYLDQVIATSAGTFLFHTGAAGQYIITAGSFPYKTNRYVIDAVALPHTVYISKLDLVDRIIAAGRIIEAISLIESDPIMKIRWEAAVKIAVNDPTAIMLLAAIGLNPEEMLRP